MKEKWCLGRFLLTLIFEKFLCIMRPFGPLSPEGIFQKNMNDAAPWAAFSYQVMLPKNDE